MKNVKNLEGAMQEMKVVSDAIKAMAKKYGIPKRARTIRKLAGVVRAHDDKFLVGRVRRKGGHFGRVTDQEIMFNLLMRKSKLQGYITAKLESQISVTLEDEEKNEGD